MSVPSLGPLSRCYTNGDSADSALGIYLRRLTDRGKILTTNRAIRRSPFARLECFHAEYIQLSCPIFTNADSLGTYCSLCVAPSKLLLISAVILAALLSLSCSYLYLRRRSSNMLVSIGFGLLATVVVWGPPVVALNEPANPTLSATLKLALTHLEFWNTLSNDDYVFDFSKQSQSPWTPGSVLNANAATWPILIAGNQAIAQLNLGRCSMLAPHVHPHATNIVVLVAGSVRTYMRAENGAIDRQTVLTPGKMTYFPKASFHSMVNEGQDLQVQSLPEPSFPHTLSVTSSSHSSSFPCNPILLPFHSC